MQTRWSRRRFLRLSAGGAALTVLAACQRAGERVTLSKAGPETPAATQVERKLLSNQNRPAVKPDWHVRFYKRFEAIDHEQWRLRIDGEVERPRTLSLEEILALPSVTQVSRMKCVECWSAKAKWEGVHYQTLAELVQPTKEAGWVYFECADDYYESLSIPQLSGPRILLAYKMDEALLLDEFGAPLRLIVPALYGYKGPKTITRMRFEKEGQAGYWPTVGPYTQGGLVKAGVDHPLDLEGSRRIGEGEITSY